jgi:hypothetical protein
LPELLEMNRIKARRSLALVAASLSEYRPFDPHKDYSAKELEPFDALADRFVRAVECGLRYFRSVEMDRFAEQSDSTRSLLERMEKLGLIRGAPLWMAMRNIRNRIVHDYLPEQTAEMFALVAGEFGEELLALGRTLAPPPTPS